MATAVSTSSLYGGFDLPDDFGWLRRISRDDHFPRSSSGPAEAEGV